MNKLITRILQNFGITLLVCAACYVIGDAFHILPQSIKDAVSWFAGNISLFAFLVCFFVGSYVLLQVVNSHNKKGKP